MGILTKQLSGLLEKQEGVRMHVRTLKRKLEDLGLKLREKQLTMTEISSSLSKRCKELASWVTGRISNMINHRV